MADDRPVEDPNEQLGRLSTDFEDFRATVLARLSRRATGSIEITLRATPQSGTLFLKGDVVNRADYPDLWAWAQEVGAVVTGGFTVGNGSTTFGLPNLQGRVIVGVGTLSSVTYALGAQGGVATTLLATNQMPSHSHPLTGGGGEAYGNGDHGGHFNASQVLAAGGSTYGVAPWNSSGTTRGYHNHGVQTEVYSTAVGGSTPVDVRQPYAAWNYAIWT